MRGLRRPWGRNGRHARAEERLGRQLELQSEGKDGWYMQESTGGGRDDGGRSSQMKWSREVGGEIDATTQQAHALFTATLDDGNGDQHSMLVVRGGERRRRRRGRRRGTVERKDDEQARSRTAGPLRVRASKAISDLVFKLRPNPSI